MEVEQQPARAEPRRPRSTATWRIGATLVLAAALALVLAPARASSASASGGVLCDGYAACAGAGFTTHGYESVASTSYWRMFPGNDCTNYAAYVESTAYGAPTPPYLLGNAGEWAASASAHGVEVNGIPSVGAVAEWNGGDTGMGADGHVAVVEEVGPNASYIVISQQAIGGDTDGYEWRRIEAGTPEGTWEPWPDNFIHFTNSTEAASGGTAAGAPIAGGTVAGGTVAGGTVAGGAIAGGTGTGIAQPESVIEGAAPIAITAEWPEGSFIDAAGSLYRIAGGAPLYLSSWSVLGAGPQPARLMSAAQLASLPAHPRNGTLLETPEGRLYRVAGGAALLVSQSGQLGAAEAPILIDPWDIRNAGKPRSHLRAAPADGTVVEGLPGRSYWTFKNGRRRPVKGRASAIAVATSAVKAYPQMSRAQEARARSAELRRAARR